jgi:hypothetical protein
MHMHGNPCMHAAYVIGHGHAYRELAVVGDTDQEEFSVQSRWVGMPFLDGPFEINGGTCSR